MSYILDALRRADAERERGRVPGLHTRIAPARAGLDEPAARAARARPRRLIAAALLALGAVAALGWWWAREAPAPGDAPTLAQPGSAASVAPAPAPTTPTTPSAAPPVPPPPAPVAVAPAPVQPILTPPPPPAARAPAPRPAAPAPAAAGSPPPGTADSELPRVADLPPPARAGLPPLQVSGATYADNPALRMLIIDGKVIQQGQDIAPGLTVENIGPRAAVLNHQGRRLRLTY